MKTAKTAKRYVVEECKGRSCVLNTATGEERQACRWCGDLPIEEFGDIVNAALAATKTAALTARTAQDVQDAAFETLVASHIATGFTLCSRMNRAYTLLAKVYGGDEFGNELQRRQANSGGLP